MLRGNKPRVKLLENRLRVWWEMMEIKPQILTAPNVTFVDAMKNDLLLLDESITENYLEAVVVTLKEP